ncbi:acetone carboxylase subunit gamma [Natronomonas marina]|jgi:acetone carboxylase gamma subunit|uniref:acetone carboxylase subunit gamma n=1 Tax=Natronomonas marina TaxID=2961939 RepID=UPI0020C9DE19|nr:acetone carboxylase subunit gamma [Natronomonas marina]
MSTNDARSIEEVRDGDDRTVGDYLAVEDGSFACAKCGHDLGPVDGNYKEHLALRERDVEDLGDLWIDPSILLDEDIVFREFLCPGCATRLATESCRRDDPIVNGLRLDPETL